MNSYSWSMEFPEWTGAVVCNGSQLGPWSVKTLSPRFLMNTPGSPIGCALTTAAPYQINKTTIIWIYDTIIIAGVVIVLVAKYGHLSQTWEAQNRNESRNKMTENSGCYKWRTKWQQLVSFVIIVWLQHWLSLVFSWSKFLSPSPRQRQDQEEMPLSLRRDPLKVVLRPRPFSSAKTLGWIEQQSSTKTPAGGANVHSFIKPEKKSGK